MANTAIHEPGTDSETRMRGLLLWAVRLGWVVLVAAGLGLALAMAPAYIRSISDNWQVQASYPAVAGVLTRAHFAWYWLTLVYGMALLYLLTGLFIFARKSDDWMALLVALTLVLLPIGFNMVGYADPDMGPALPWSAAGFGLYRLMRALSTLSLLALFHLFPRGYLARTPPRWLQQVKWVVVGLLRGVYAVRGDRRWAKQKAAKRQQL